METMKLLALSGSLRKSSYNTAAIAALKELAPEQIEITIGEISSLPLFNPDREGDDIPSLEALKQSIHEADGLIIASPEYAHGISGPMKNALDWLVSGAEVPYKPIMLVNTSPRASHALSALSEVLVTMSGIIVDNACVAVPLLGSNLNKEGILNDQGIRSALESGLLEFCSQIQAMHLAVSPKL